MSRSSLRTRVDVEDWLDEDLPSAVHRLWVIVPDLIASEGRPDGYPSVASDTGLGDVEAGRLRTVGTGDDELRDELVGDNGISMGFRL